MPKSAYPAVGDRSRLRRGEADEVRRSEPLWGQQARWRHGYAD